MRSLENFKSTLVYANVNFTAHFVSFVILFDRMAKKF